LPLLKNKLHVDLGDLHDERQQLTSFLNSKLKTEVTPNQNRLDVPSDGLSPQDLEHAVVKFVYHMNLNNTHFVSVEGNVVKINRFKNSKPAKKCEKEKKGGQHQTAAQSWGL
jgi:hypothetical protein